MTMAFDPHLKITWRKNDLIGPPPLRGNEKRSGAACGNNPQRFEQRPLYRLSIAASDFLMNISVHERLRSSGRESVQILQIFRRL